MSRFRERLAKADARINRAFAEEVPACLQTGEGRVDGQNAALCVGDHHPFDGVVQHHRRQALALVILALGGFIAQDV